MKNTRINWRKLTCSTGEILRFPLAGFESSVYVWCKGTGEFSITVDFLNDPETGELREIPVAYGTSVDGAYCFDGAVSLTITPKSKSVKIAADVIQTGINRRETVDPVPRRLVLPSQCDTFEQRLIRQFTDLLDQRTGKPTERGHNYEVHDEYSDDDPHFGPGYAVDEDLESALDGEISRRRNTSASADSPAGLQPADVPNNDKRDRRELDVQPTAPTRAPAPDTDHSDLVAAITAALADRKSAP